MPDLNQSTTTPTIRTTNERKLVGQRLTMSFVDDRTGQLWRHFMPRRKEIRRLSDDLISMTVYSLTHFTGFDPASKFDKWAAVEVAHFDDIPDGMEAFTLARGLYAVFAYKGSSTDNSVFQYILGEWLPDSSYALDDRPHFDVLGDKYRNDSPDSEEEIWIPIKAKV